MGLQEVPLSKFQVLQSKSGHVRTVLQTGNVYLDPGLTYHHFNLTDEKFIAARLYRNPDDDNSYYFLFVGPDYTGLSMYQVGSWSSHTHYEPDLYAVKPYADAVYYSSQLKSLLGDWSKLKLLDMVELLVCHASTGRLPLSKDASQSTAEPNFSKPGEPEGPLEH